MPLPASRFLLRAKQLEIESVRNLASRAELATTVGQLVQVLQRERGASTVFLASQGQQLADLRDQAREMAQPLADRLRAQFDEQLQPNRCATARIMALTAWVLMDLTALDTLRQQVDQAQIGALDCIAAFSRIIAGLVELVAQLADPTIHPGVSRRLVAYVHLVQGKEAAGQERALGGLLFASGLASDPQQQRLAHLIEAQDRNLTVFAEFADDGLKAQWDRLQLTPQVAQLERLRRTLCSARPGTALDTELTNRWFDITSERITNLWQLETELVQGLRFYCANQLETLEQELADTEGLMQRLREHPPAHADAVSAFFSQDEPPPRAPTLPAANAQALSSMVEQLQAQGARLARMEIELEAAKRALHERKVIERAKGVLMARLGMTEETAFRTLQKTAMDQNRRLLDIAEATLALPDLAFARPAGDPTAH